MKCSNSKWLTGNYFTPEDEMSIDGELKRILIWSRKRFLHGYIKAEKLEWIEFFIQ